VYGRPDTFVGILIGAFGVGAVTASVIPSGEGRRPARTIAIMLALFAAGMIGFALSPALEAGLVALAVAGFGYLSSQTRVTTLLQLEVSDAERGRVMALWSVAFLGTRPLASLVDGGLATVLGPRAATLLMAMPIVVASAAMLMGPGRTVGEALERSRVRR
jgi:MFS family permease